MAIRASAAACDITPDESMPLAGFTGRKRDSKGEGYPLYASAVHVRGGSGGIIIISLDLFSIDPSAAELIRKQVSSATGTRETNVFVCTTGCMSAPYAEHALYMKHDPSYADVDVDYMEWVVEMAVKAASEAAVSSRPASIAIVKSSAGGTIIVKGENGRVIAAVIVHDDVPDYLGPDNDTVSADHVGALRSKLTSRFGGEPVIAYIPAPSADQILEKRASYGEDAAKAAGESLADSIVAQLKTLKSSDFMPDPSVSGSLIDLYSLPRRELPQLTDASALLNAAVKMSVSGGESTSDPSQQKFARWALIEANRTMSMVLAFKDGVLETAMQEYDPVYIQSLTIGPINIIGIPCAVLRACARHLASQAGPDVWFAQGVNGTLMGSIMTCGTEQADGRLLSAVFERDVAGRLITGIMTATSGT